MPCSCQYHAHFSGADPIPVQNGSRPQFSKSTTTKLSNYPALCCCQQQSQDTGP